MRRSRGESLWLFAALTIAAAVLLPLLALAWTAGQGSPGLWSHLAAHLLPRAALNTAALLLGVGVVAMVIGTGCAWLVSAYDFPGRRAFGWALLLPLAVPTYIIAFAYLDLLHPLGPVQSALRALLGYDSPRDFRLPDIRSLPACIVLLGLVLYPYVYLTVRTMFATQAASLIEAARSLGVGGGAAFLRVALPLARPAIAIGVALVLLETLNDIGASEFLGVKTLTVAIYSTWVTRSDLPGAAQIALAMLTAVILVLAIERYGRRRQRYAVTSRPRAFAPLRLCGARAAAATLACALPVLLGFVAPAAYLAVEAWERLHGAGVSPQLWASVGNTLTVAALTTATTLIAGLVLIWALRLAQLQRRPQLATAALRIGSLGYALPGTVLAIALLTPMAWFDATVAAIVGVFGGSGRALLMGSLAALVLACTLRFLAIATGGLEAGMARIPPSLDQAARGLGVGPSAALRRVHLRLLRPALAAVTILVFVDTMKELPATLMLRPLGFDTLATWLYAEAARGTYEEGAVAALLIVLVGLPAVMLLAWTGFGERDAARGATGDVGSQRGPDRSSLDRSSPEQSAPELHRPIAPEPTETHIDTHIDTHGDRDARRPAMSPCMQPIEPMATTAAADTGGTSAAERLHLDAIEVTYPAAEGGLRRVVEALSLRLAPGDIGCLLGASGCGKTTVLRAIAGFEPLRAGRIVLDGRRVAAAGAGLPPESRRIGMMFQDYALFPHLDVAGNIGFGLGALPKPARAARVAEMLALAGLSDRIHAYPHELSGGQQQRVALARALAPAPALLLLDEPFSNLDANTRSRLVDDTRALLKAAGATALLVTHDQGEAFAIADRIGVMAEGRILQWDTPACLYRQPADRRVAEFIGRGDWLRASTLGLDGGGSDARVSDPRSSDIDEVRLRPGQLRPDPDGPIQALLEAATFRGPGYIGRLRFESGETAEIDLDADTAAGVGRPLRLRLHADDGLIRFPR